MYTTTVPSTIDQEDPGINFFEEIEIDNSLPALQQQSMEISRLFIIFCKDLYTAKINSSRQDWRSTRASLSWNTYTATSYLKVGEFLMDINLFNLELLDVRTVITLCTDKYAAIILRLKTERLTVEEVRKEMSAINEETKKPKVAPKLLEWERTIYGQRDLVLRLDEEAGEEFEQKYKASLLPLPLFIRDLLNQYKPQTYLFPVESTLRDNIDLQVGVMVMPKDLGNQTFINWFENQPGVVIEFSSEMGTVQFFKLHRSD